MLRKCYAKVNLSLDVLGKRQDGYHEIDTIMTRINLYDVLKVKRNKENKFNYDSNVSIGKVEDNLIFKAYKLLEDRVSDKGIDVYLEKNIPLAAGLAGGSTDASEMIKALNELWNLDLSTDEMMLLSQKLGADLPFFFLGKSARARGVGEKLSPINIHSKLYLLLINDGTEISSAFVYKNIGSYGNIPTNMIVEGLAKGEVAAIKACENVMEDVVFKFFPYLEDIKAKLIGQRAVKALVSGSGASIFGVFLDQDSRNLAYENLKDEYKFIKKVDLIDD